MPATPSTLCFLMRSFLARAATPYVAVGCRAEVVAVDMARRIALEGRGQALADVLPVAEQVWGSWR